MKQLKTTILVAVALGLLVAACSHTTDGPNSASQDAASQQARTQYRQAKGTLELTATAPAARLPKGIAPTHYSLHLDIDPRKERFSGSVSIEIELQGSTDMIWLHGKDLNVESASATLPDGAIVPLDWEQVNAAGAAKLTAASTLPAGKAMLQLNYNAPFNTSLEGLYKVVKDEDSYAFTQFEATSARLAFPSFDEPSQKVTFDLSMTVPAEYVGITNTPQLSETPQDNQRKTLRFATTKPLPTYLIAFAVGPFDVVEWAPVPSNSLRSQALPLRGITTRGKAQEIHYALENTADIVTALEQYFDTPYPYAKLDIIAVPDFSSGAMENAGIITYREQLILLDQKSPVNQKRAFFITHAHELAHQWFGNLVTPVWWDDIWLNESFATWNSHIVLDSLYPDEKYRNSLHNTASWVMRNDSLASARQIREPIVRHEDIGSAFNGITYQKGGGVLSMFESFLGRDNFRKGIRAYMQTFAFGNTTADDFIGAIADANPQVPGADLRAAFTSYIEQPGLPLISADLTCSSKGAEVELQQRRYLPTGSTGSSDQTWTIPVCLSSIHAGESNSECFLLKQQRETITLKDKTCPSAVLPNTGGNSYYRWSLPAQQWASLMESFDKLSINEQISVANSLSAALNDGSMTVEDYLAAVPKITESESWRVAMAPLSDLYKIKDFVATAGERKVIQAKLSQWYQPQLDRLNALPNRRADEAQFRAFTMSALAYGAEDAAVRNSLVTLAKAYTGFEGDEALHPDALESDLRRLALNIAAQDLGQPFADLLWRHFLQEDNAQLRQYLLYAMAQSPDQAVAASMRGKILSPQLRDNEISNIFYGQMSQVKNRQHAWDWSAQNMDGILDRIPTWKKGQVPFYFSSFCDRASADAIEEFFTPIIDDLESGPRYLANSLETIRLCAAFADFHQN
ncbi:MAG: alanyl aminopeptidase [Halioglobus sp.]|jgi:alanyl aminopeptidase